MTCIDFKNGQVTENCPDLDFVIALGNFDGVHVAHRKLIGLADSLRNRIAPCAGTAVLYFSALPEDYLKEHATPYLLLPDRKQQLLKKAGAEFAFVFSFPELQHLSPSDFIDQILKEKCHAVGSVCGYNFRYGYQAAGTPEQLKLAFPDTCEILSEVKLDNITVSSTEIRRCIQSGNIESANYMLGDSFTLDHEVTSGKHLGTSLGIPTINQAFPQCLVVPKYGVYATQTVIDGTVYPSISNVGVRPTVEHAGAVNCETHILDYSGNLYGSCVSVRFLHFLREEQCFSSVTELQKTILQDIEKVRKMIP